MLGRSSWLTLALLRPGVELVVGPVGELVQAFLVRVGRVAVMPLNLVKATVKDGTTLLVLF